MPLLSIYQLITINLDIKIIAIHFTSIFQSYITQFTFSQKFLRFRCLAHNELAPTWRRWRALNLRKTTTRTDFPPSSRHRGALVLSPSFIKLILKVHERHLRFSLFYLNILIHIFIILHEFAYYCVCGCVTAYFFAPCIILHQHPTFELVLHPSASVQVRGLPAEHDPRIARRPRPKKRAPGICCA